MSKTQIKKLKEQLILFQQRDNIFMDYWDKFPEDIKYELDEKLMRLIVGDFYE